MPWFNSHLAFQAGSAEALCEAVETRLAARAVVLPERSAELDARASLRGLPHGQLWGCSYGLPLTLRFLESDYVRVQMPLKGTARVTAGGDQIVLDTSRACLSRAAATIEFGEAYEQFALRLPHDLLVRKLTALTGEAAAGRLEFAPEIDLETPAGRNLRNVMMCMAAAAGDLQGPLAATVLGEIEQSFLVALLCTANHSQRGLLEHDTQAAAPWQVRRVESYIEAHWREPLSIEDIADAAGTSARSMFRSFQQHRGYSPKEFLKRVRLGHARRLLRDGAPDRTVTDVALDCGFGDLSRFSKDYLAAYGETPSATLRASRGAAPPLPHGTAVAA
ncbi:helix-turn-helix domain-containing protein [Desertibaculum subflavum]|uniref:helix-turn-helix domain-containing protein n=1 Tax=Desertibaculum subflavum TaxID=2268458 RepID=UPI0013C51D81